MVGQRELQSKITTMITNGNYPRFSLFVGQRGGGKKTIARQIAHSLNALLIECGTSADAIRDMIEQAYKVTDTTVYLVADADSMSAVAKNALLKITEEPPNNVYIIMTLQSTEFTLNTILSRAHVFMLEPYTEEELSQCVGNADSEVNNAFLRVCNTPYDVMLLKRYDYTKFLDYVRLVVDNIAEVPGANAFKISDKLAIDKDADDTKYDLALFWQAFVAECLELTHKAVRGQADTDTVTKYIHGAIITSQYLNTLHINSLNKSFLFDMWLFAIRKDWMQYADD